MTLVASPRTRNLSLSSARAVPASTRAVAISSATLGFTLSFMGESSFDVLRSWPRRADDPPRRSLGLREDVSGEFQHAPARVRIVAPIRLCRKTLLRSVLQARLADVVACAAFFQAEKVNIMSTAVLGIALICLVLSRMLP